MERLLQSFVHVVDDDASFRALVAPRLKDAGYKLAAYLSAQDFLDRLPSDDVPGCILLDLQLGLTGLKLQSRLRQCGSIAARWIAGEPVLNDELDAFIWVAPELPGDLQFTEGLQAIIDSARRLVGV